MIPNAAPFFGSHLRWSCERSEMPFAVRVVEPARYAPAGHFAIFNAVIESLRNPAAEAVDGYEDVRIPPAGRRYDLVTFPEAFVSTNALLAVAAALVGEGPSGCLHMGLRPDADEKSHLYSVAALGVLLDGLDKLVDASLGDLADFRRWFEQQQHHHFFNVGCVLAVDAESRLRVCLHPKIVRSKFEIDVLPERRMEEANLLTLITLVPRNPRFGSITLQPLICSDALNLQTDRMLMAPIPAITEYAGCIEQMPNHVDVVSVVTCTPQRGGTAPTGGRYHVWHGQFLEAFLAAAQSPQCFRHHFAAIVLANYTQIAKPMDGGLSGAFLPTAPRFPKSIPEVLVACWGMPSTDDAEANNVWSKPWEDALTKWKSRGFVAGLDPTQARRGDEARVLAFDIHRLPREASPWHPTDSIAAASVHVCRAGPTGGLQLQKRDPYE